MLRALLCIVFWSFATPLMAEECAIPNSEVMSEAACKLYEPPPAHSLQIEKWDSELLAVILGELNTKDAAKYYKETEEFIADCKVDGDSGYGGCTLDAVAKGASLSDLILDVDWKDYESVEPSARLITRTLNLGDGFRFRMTQKQANSYSKKYNKTAVVVGLTKFDQWLKPKGYRFIHWDTGDDSFRGFVLKTENVKKLAPICDEADDAEQKAESPLWWGAYVHFKLLWQDDERICKGLTAWEKVKLRFNEAKN